MTDTTEPRAPVRRTVSVSAWLTPDIHTRLKRQAHAREESVDRVIRRMVDIYLDLCDVMPIPMLPTEKIRELAEVFIVERHMVKKGSDA